MIMMFKWNYILITRYHELLFLFFFYNEKNMKNFKNDNN